MFGRSCHLYFIGEIDSEATRKITLLKPSKSHRLFSATSYTKIALRNLNELRSVALL
jgi:hypothetical protein